MSIQSSSETPLIVSNNELEIEENPSKQGKSKAAIAIILVLVVVIVVAVFVILGTENYDGDCYTECCTWEGVDFCPGDCIFQDGGEYCPESTDERVMLRYEFGESDEPALCNDGTTPAHYYRPSLPGPHEKSWIFRFEGGSSCWDETTCDEREENDQPFLTTAESKIIYEDPEWGILNGSPEYNPDWHDWNVVSAHYCTSDAWSGTTPAEENDIGWNFMGHHVVMDVFKTAKARWNMSDVDRIIVHGFSAGGIGIMSGSEFVESFLQGEFPDTEIFFLQDSSWFLASMENWGEMGQTSGTDYDFIDQMELGYNLWGSVVSENCLAAGLTYECLVPEYSFPYMTTVPKHYILQNYYDSMQSILHTADSESRTGEGVDEWYVAMANITFETMVNAEVSFFMSNCENHDNLNRFWFVDITVDGEYSTDKMMEYYNEIYPAGTGPSRWYDEFLDEDGGPCLSCNPTCPVPTEPPHSHQVEGEDNAGAGAPGGAD